MKQTLMMVLAAAALLAGALTGAFARQDSPDDAHVRAAREMMAATGAENAFRAILAVMGAQITTVVVQQNKGKEKKAREILKPILADAASRREEMVAQAAKVYAKRFSVAEMKQITDFYKTPVGRKLVAQLPQIMQESMQIGRRMSQEIGAEVIRRFKAEAKKQGL